MPVSSASSENSSSRFGPWPVSFWIWATATTVLSSSLAWGKDPSPKAAREPHALPLLAAADSKPNKPKVGAALPQGALPKDSEAVKESQVSAENRRSYCYADIADVAGGNVQFEAGGQAFYLLTPKDKAAPSKGKAASQGKVEAGKKDRKAAKLRYTLYKVQRKSRKAEALISLESRPNASLAVWGDPAALVSIVAFTGRGGTCFEGNAALTSISLTKTEQAAVSGLGLYQLVRGTFGSYLFDMKRASVVEFDPQTFQVKQLRTVSKGHRPLYWDAEERRMTTWQDDGTQRGLVVYEGDGAQVSRRLAFKKGDRVLQQNGQFAALRADAASNALELQEIADWSGQAKPGKYKLEIPPAYSVSQTMVSAHFGRRVAVVAAANPLTKARWQRVFLFDYTKPKPLVTLSLTGRQYAHQAALDPTGTYAVIEVRDSASQATSAVRIYDFSKKAFEEVELPDPAEKK